MTLYCSFELKKKGGEKEVLRARFKEKDDREVLLPRKKKGTAFQSRGEGKET